MMEVTIAELEAYLLDNYGNGGIDQSLFMKLVEEIGEVAEVLNKKAGRKKSDGEDLQSQLGNELADVIHYAVAIAALNDIDMNEMILEKDKTASVKYNHGTNLEQLPFTFIIQQPRLKYLIVNLTIANVKLTFPNN